ncbi:MAG: hypothetical protein Q4C48_08285 [Lachnospiraceae bacterium]|nr:hypothetical protein [Lachnospiraceae bacterium]
MKGKRVLFASLLLLACTFMIGLAFAKEDYDFDVEAKNVKASVWGRVSYTDNTSILPVIKDVINYNIHLIGTDKGLFTQRNAAELEMSAYKGNVKEKTKTIRVYKGEDNVTNGDPWKVSNSVTELRVKIEIDGTIVTRRLTD